jgi:WD40 repeat protein
MPNHPNAAQVIAGCDDGSIRIWDLEDGSARLLPGIAHAEPVTAVTTGLDGDAPVLVSSSAAGPVRTWWLASATPVGPALPGEEPVAVATMDGRCVVISPDAHDRICVWDPKTAREVGAFEGLHAPVTALAVTRLPGGPVVVMGHGPGHLTVGDLASGQIVARMAGGHDQQVGAIVTTVVDGRWVVVSGASDGTVRRWDLASGAPLGAPSHGHHGPLHAPGRIYALAIATLAGRPVAVSSGWDGELWMWELTSGERIGEPLDDNNGDVQALIVSHHAGRQHVICGGIDEPVLRVWDLDHRTLARVLPGPAHVLALAPLPAK